MLTQLIPLFNFVVAPCRMLRMDGIGALTNQYVWRASSWPSRMLPALMLHDAVRAYLDGANADHTEKLH